MVSQKIITLLALSAFFASPAVAIPRNGNRFGGNQRANQNQQQGAQGAAGAAAASGTTPAVPVGTGTAGGAAVLQLNPANVQTGSQSDGQAVQEAGQVPSLTDNANFINFCTGKTLTNGLQVKTGSCNGIVMGDIPANTNMVSSMLINPAPAQDLVPNQTFQITVQMQGLAAGSFTNPTITYYAAPQTLNGGNIVGHTHVTVQTLGTSLTPSAAPDPSKFVFFKGINDAGNGQGLLSATVTGGLPAGFYRVCTMSSAANHQPVLMPVAQRGAQDDCTKFTVGQGTAGTPTTGGGAASGTGAAVASSAAAAPAQGGRKGGRKGRGGRKGKKIGEGNEDGFEFRA